MQVLENFSLKSLNTFGVEAIAARYVAIEQENDLQLLFSDKQMKNYPRLVLGGGSNVLLQLISVVCLYISRFWD